MNTQVEVTAAANVEFVTFSVARQKFCVEITKVREIRRWSPVTLLPHAPYEVLGVMNLRGTIIPIYDLSARFGLGMSDTCERNVVIVSTIDDRSVGLLVESVSEITSIDINTIQETPNVNSEETQECIQGVVSIDGELARVINLSAVVSVSEGAVE